MKRTVLALLGALMLGLGGASAVADPLPAGTSDRIFLTDLAGDPLPGEEIVFAEVGGTETFSGGICLGCTNSNVLLLEPDGSISDIYTFDGQFNWTSDIEGGPLLQRPTNGFPTFEFLETAEPIEVTAAMGGPPTDTDRRLFIQSDGNVPEPGSIALLALGLSGLGFARRRLGK